MNATKFALITGSQEAIASFAAHMCDSKVKTMPTMLAKRYQSTCVKLEERVSAFDALLEEKQATHHMTIDPEECLLQVKAVAKRKSKHVIIIVNDIKIITSKK